MKGRRRQGFPALAAPETPFTINRRVCYTSPPSTRLMLSRSSWGLKGLVI